MTDISEYADRWGKTQSSDSYRDGYNDGVKAERERVSEHVILKPWQIHDEKCICDEPVCPKCSKKQYEEGVKAERERILKNLPKVIVPNVEPPKNGLSQNQIFAGGQMNMHMRVMELLSDNQ